jgi:signal transduction histidine kinase
MNALDRLAERPGIAANAGFAVVFAGVLAVEGRNIRGYHGDWRFDVAVGVVVCAAALLRGFSRTRAAAAGLAVAAAAEVAAWHWGLPGQPGPAAALAVLVLVGSAVRALPGRPATVVAVGGALVTLGSMERYLIFIGNGTPSTFSATRLLAIGWGLAVGTGLWLRLLDARRRVAIEAVRRGERLDLARELHDAAAHHITGIVLQAQAARIAARRGGDALDDALAGIETAGAGALASMRQVIGLLRDGDDPDDAGGLTPEPERLDDLVRRFAARGPAVRLRMPAGPAEADWPPEVTSTVYRVVQEALTNIARHAPDAREVTVTVAHGRDGVTVEVTDDAPAGSARFPLGGGYGLVGMRERVDALGGTLSAGPAAGAGWSVQAVLPVAGRP